MIVVHAIVKIHFRLWALSRNVCLNIHHAHNYAGDNRSRQRDNGNGTSLCSRCLFGWNNRRYVPLSVAKISLVTHPCLRKRASLRPRSRMFLHLCWYPRVSPIFLIIFRRVYVPPPLFPSEQTIRVLRPFTFAFRPCYSFSEFRRGEDDRGKMLNGLHIGPEGLRYISLSVKVKGSGTSGQGRNCQFRSSPLCLCQQRHKERDFNRLCLCKITENPGDVSQHTVLLNYFIYWFPNQTI